jgi:hypothetical protein
MEFSDDQQKKEAKVPPRTQVLLTLTSPPLTPPQRKAEADLHRDIERIADLVDSSEAPFIITVHDDFETREVAVRPKQAVHDAIAAAFGCPPGKIAEVLFGNDAVQPGDSFEAWGIEALTPPARLLSPSSIM